MKLILYIIFFFISNFSFAETVTNNYEICGTSENPCQLDDSSFSVPSGIPVLDTTPSAQFEESYNFSNEELSDLDTKSNNIISKFERFTNPNSSCINPSFSFPKFSQTFSFDLCSHISYIHLVVNIFAIIFTFLFLFRTVEDL